MTNKHVLRSCLAALSVGALGLLASCGGGDTSEVDSVAPAERKESHALVGRHSISWSTAFVKSEVALGTSVTVPVTLTTTKALRDARILFLPDLRDAVTVSPELISSMAAGESRIITLTLAPGAAEVRKTIAGFVLVYDKNGTLSRPLPVLAKLVLPTVVSPEVGVKVTLPAGFSSRATSELVEVWRPTTSEETGEHDGRPSLMISFDPNPDGLSQWDFYSITGPGGDLGSTPTAVRVGTKSGFQYEPPFGLSPNLVIVIPTTGGFIRILDQGSTSYANGSLPEILSNIEFLR